MNMKNVGVAALVGVAWAGFAQAADSLPAPGKLTVGGVKVHALVDTYYQYNFSQPGLTAPNTAQSSLAITPQASLRAYDRGNRQFDINQATVGLSYDANPVGFDVRVGMGTQLEVLNADTRNADSASTASGSTFEHIRRATMTWKPNMFSLTVGRYDAEFGLERIDSVDNWNYGRSLQFAQAQPKFYTGLLAGFELTKEWNLNLGYSNGVNRYLDNNKTGSYLAQLSYRADRYSAGLSYNASPERFDRATDFNHYLNAHVKYDVSDSLGVAGEATYTVGKDNTVGTDSFGRAILKNPTRIGASALGHVSFLDSHWETLRVEYYNDKDGFDTLRAEGSNIWAFTLTHRYMVSKNMSLWAETRFDHSNRDVFVNNDLSSNKRNTQWTALAAGTFNI